ncbi:MAG: class I tRNA ligase family protein [Patescibacteria group bacterium]
MKDYDHKKIEKKWQAEWAKKKAYKTEDNSKKKKYYVLDMFPYPSGTGLHVGHPKGYIGSDVYARFKRMQGFNVLHPMGYDAFGLPAEQYAIQHNIHPRKAVELNIKTFEKQLSNIGLSFDWDRKVNTTDPEYYRWTQWIFLKIFESWYDKKKDKARPIADLIKIFEKSGSVGADAASDAVVPFSAKEWKAKSEKEKQDVLMKYRLAYEGFSEVNWCAEMGTVLANDEVVDGPQGTLVSERGGFPVEKRQMRQWFMRITAYAERLLTGLDGLHWSEHIKEIERNWIGKSEGAEITFKIVFEGGQKPGYIPAFTTRADTLFGAAFLVLAPEHLWVTLAVDDDHVGVLKNRDEVKKYITEVKNKTTEERTSDDKAKTGVMLRGVKAVNPANGEEIPMFVADFVLAQYGTGAVFGDAHDERDVEFAKKFGIPLRETVLPNIIDKRNPPVAGKKTVERKNVHPIVRDPKTGKYLALQWKKYNWTTFPMGGIEEGEDVVDAARREVREETGFTNLKLTKVLPGQVRAEYFAAHKDQNRVAFTTAVLFELEDYTKVRITDENQTDIIWLDESELNYEHMTHAEVDIWKEKMETGATAYTGEGVLINSRQFTGMKSEDARREIIKYVEGKVVTKYKMRDAVFARQRYWGEPIPLVHTKDGVIKPLLDKNLPLKLPHIESYKPTGTGESPLASEPSWVKKGYETNTMPGWASSSWYFFRYMDPKNKKVFADKKKIAYWKNVDLYVGGAEHATGHILYARFWNKFLKDCGLIPMEEPFQAWKSPGLILGTDGRKMGKRYGNGINPDDVVATYGADTLRVYEMFMGPFEAYLPWSTENIIGSRRFVERVWRLCTKITPKAKNDKKFETLLHKTIKKVTDDIAGFAFNTAISSMMILVNEMEKSTEINQKNFEMFLKILSPFAPHVTEEIWRELGHKTLLVSEIWPKADPKKMKESEVRIMVQVNGKVRAEFMAEPDEDESKLIVQAQNLPEIGKWLLGKDVKKVIYVPNRLINIVI